MRRTRMILILLSITTAALLSTTTAVAQTPHRVDKIDIDVWDAPLPSTPTLGGYEVLCKTKAYLPTEIAGYVLGRTEAACWIKFSGFIRWFPLKMPQMLITSCVQQYLGDEIHPIGAPKCESEKFVNKDRADVFADIRCSPRSEELKANMWFKTYAFVRVMFPSGKRDMRKPKSATTIVWNCLGLPN